MNKIVSTAIIVLVVLVVGLGAGFFIKALMDASVLAKNEKIAKAIEVLSSPLVPSIVAYGQVESINGRVITLSYSGKTLSVEISSNAVIYSYSAGSGAAGGQKQIKFENIKKGDTLNVSIKLSSDGSLVGQMVMMIPVPSAK